MDALKSLLLVTKLILIFSQTPGGCPRIYQRSSFVNMLIKLLKSMVKIESRSVHLALGSN